MTVQAKSNAAPAIISAGDNTFSITRQASNGFSRDVEALKTEVQAEAAKYCAENGKQLRVVSLTSEKPRFALGYASAKIVFKALDAADPDLKPAPAITAPGPIEHTTPTDDLYTELVKLDDLRKKGILTDEEFQSEKKKVLNRSR